MHDPIKYVVNTTADVYRPNTLKGLFDALLETENIEIEHSRYDSAAHRVDLQIRISDCYFEPIASYIKEAEIIEYFMGIGLIAGFDQTNRLILLSRRVTTVLVNHPPSSVVPIHQFIADNLDSHLQGLLKLHIQNAYSLLRMLTGDTTPPIPWDRYDELSILQKQVILWNFRDPRGGYVVQDHVAATWWYIQGYCKLDFLRRLPIERQIDAVYLADNFTLLNYARRKSKFG